MFRELLKERKVRSDLERCGVIIGEPIYAHTHPPRNIRLIELPNRARNRRDNYVIRMGDLNQALIDAGATTGQIVGFWHTHPYPSLSHPSQPDWDSIMLGERHWWHAVFHPESNMVTWYDYDENEIEEIDK